MMPTGPSTWEQIQTELATSKRRLDQLLADDEKPPFWNYANPVDIALPLYTGTAAFGSFTVPTEFTFIAKQIEAFCKVTGVLHDEASSPATLTLPETIRPSVFDYTWSVRDSGTDRDWSNIALPSAVMRGGNVNPNRFLKGQAWLRGGSRVTVTINPTYLNLTNTAVGILNPTAITLQVIFTGVAVRGVS